MQALFRLGNAAKACLIRFGVGFAIDINQCKGENRILYSLY